MARAQGVKWKIRWTDKEAMAVLAKATGDVLYKGARMISARAILNARKYAQHPGGYWNEFGSVSKRIKAFRMSAARNKFGVEDAGIFSEFPGWQMEHGSKGKRGWGKSKARAATPSKARPFMVPAFQSSRAQMLDMMRGVM